MGPGTFWGLFLVLMGIALILKTFFKLDIPVIRIIFALLFILLGFKILFGNFKYNKFKSDGNDIIFGEMNINADNLKHENYNIIFGKGIFDLRDIDINVTGTKYLKIGCVFGGVDLILKDSMPVKISIESVFSGGQLPDGSSTVFGNSTYISPNYDPLKPHFNIRLELVFSGVNGKRI